jgi:hypothetical protein
MRIGESGEQMSGKETIAAVLLTLTAVVYGIIPLIVDISPTHILHPAWSPHARFHVVWQISVNTMLGLLVVLLIWWPGANRQLRLKIAALLGCIALGGFVVAALTRHLYAGAFSEPGGVPPVGGVDANVLAFTPRLAIQLIALVLVLIPGRKPAPM